MASTRTFIDARKGMTYSYDRATDAVTAISSEGEEAVERMSRSLVERLTAQHVPSVLWMGSPSVNV